MASTKEYLNYENENHSEPMRQWKRKDHCHDIFSLMTFIIIVMYFYYVLLLLRMAIQYK